MCGRLLGAEDVGAVAELADIIAIQLHHAELRWLKRHEDSEGGGTS